MNESPMIPEQIEAYLKSYDVADFDLSSDEDLYLIAIEVLARGFEKDKAWVYQQRSPEQLRAIFSAMKGRAMGEDVRKVIRKELNLTEEEIPVRESFGW